MQLIFFKLYKHIANIHLEETVSQNVDTGPKYTEVVIEDRVLEVSFFNQGDHCID